MRDWPGGRTSEFAAVGLLPTALQVVDIGEFIAENQLADAAKHRKNVKENHAAQFALELCD